MGENKTDKLFQDKLRHFEPDTPEDLWEGVKYGLEKQESRKRAMWWRYSSIAAAILLAFSSGYFFNDYQNINRFKPVTEETPASPSENKNTISSESNDNSNNLIKLSEDEPVVNKPQVKSISNRNISDLNTSASERQFLKNQEEDEASFTQTQNTSATPYEEAGDIADLTQLENLPPNLTVDDLFLVKSLTSVQTGENTSTALTNILKKESGNVENKVTPAPFRLIALGGPVYGLRRVDIYDNSEFTKSNVENEEVSSSFAAGVKLNYRLAANWELQTGFLLNRWNQQGEKVNLERDFTTPTNTGSIATGTTSLASFDVDVNSSTTTENLSTSQLELRPEIHYAYTYIDIPLGAAYFLVDKRWKLKLQAGLNTRILSSSLVTLEYPEGTSEEISPNGSATVNFQVTAGPALAYRLTDQFQIHLEPSFHYGITPVENLTELNTYHHQLLFFSGLSYNFK